MPCEFIIQLPHIFFTLACKQHLSCTYDHGENDTRQPELDNDKEVLLKESNDPSHGSKGKDDPVKQYFCEPLSLVVHSAVVANRRRVVNQSINQIVPEYAIVGTMFRGVRR